MSDPVTRLNAALEGRYAIERELAEGGLATVYRAGQCDRRHQLVRGFGGADRELRLGSIEGGGVN